MAQVQQRQEQELQQQQEQLKPEPRLQPGQTVWFSSDKEARWTLGCVKAVLPDNQSCTVQDIRQRGLKANAVETVTMDKVLPPNKGASCEDMTSLKYIHEPAIMYNLEERSLNSKPYTFLGTILITVNPVIDVGDPKQLCGSRKALDKPHPYGIAERALQQMTFANKRLNASEDPQAGAGYQPNQSIIVSGESGSGKSESCKRVLRHLVSRSHSSQGSGSSDSLSSLEQALLDANPVLESFGNAQTTHNHNSSRFGKLTKLHFESDHLDRAKIDTYLLERSRVTWHADGERNFHIFYRLLVGMDTEERATMGLPRGSSGWQEFCIAQTTESVPDWLFKDDVKAFAALEKGLSSLSFTPEERNSLFSVVAALLHLGNVEFGVCPDSTTGEDKLFIVEQQVDPASPKTTTDWVSSLLGISEEALQGILCTRTIQVAGDSLKVQLNKVEAQHTRDGLVRAIYAALFDWVISRTNKYFARNCNAKPSRMSSSIGVLDIFGFECFANNGLEQLLINFTNETLQKTFSEQVLIAEANLYRSEGLLVPEEDIGSSDDMLQSKCTELLMGKRGMLRTIEDLSTTPQPSDAKLLQQMHKSFASHSHYAKPHPRYVDSQFIVAHFAGPVVYTVDGFVQKNVDKVPSFVSELLQGSTDTLITQKLFSPEPTLAAGSRRLPRTASSVGKMAGLCGKFSKEICRLIDDLEVTNCSFIRCIKPNPKLVRETKRDWFDRRYVCNQMRYLSIPQTAQVLAAGGLPTRIPYAEIYNTYKQVLPDSVIQQWNSIPARATDYSAFTRALFFALDVDKGLFRMGLSKVFFRTGALKTVEEIFENATSLKGPKLKKVSKRFALYNARLCWRRCLAKVIVANHFTKLFLRARARANAAKVLARFMAWAGPRRQFVLLRHGNLRLQAYYRGARGRACANALREQRRKELEASKKATEEEERRRKLQEQEHEHQQQQVPEVCEEIEISTSREEDSSPAVTSLKKRMLGDKHQNRHDVTSQHAMIISPSRPQGTGRSSIVQSPGMDNNAFGSFKKGSNSRYSVDRVERLEQDLSMMQQSLSDVQMGQQTLLRMVEESQRRERILLEEHLRLLRRLEKTQLYQQTKPEPPKQLKQEPAWGWCLFGRCYKE